MRLAEGQFVLQLRGQAGCHYTIQGSTNLTDWLPLPGNPAGAILELFEPSPLSFPFRFYRAISGE